MFPAATNFLILHGTLGGPETNWFPWLRSELQSRNYNVACPSLPTPAGQSFAAWLAIARQILKDFDISNTVLIGHSMGAGFALRLAEISPTPFKAIVAVCPFIRDVGLQPYDELNATFLHHDFNWRRIQQNAGKIFCFAGDDDPYVPLSYSREVADKCEVGLSIVEKGGHLNGESGFLEFPLLLEKMRQTGFI